MTQYISAFHFLLICLKNSKYNYTLTLRGIGCRPEKKKKAIFNTFWIQAVTTKCGKSQGVWILSLGTEIVNIFTVIKKSQKGPVWFKLIFLVLKEIDLNSQAQTNRSCSQYRPCICCKGLQDLLVLGPGKKAPSGVVSSAWQALRPV